MQNPPPQESHPAWESLLVQGLLAPEGWVV